MVRLAERMDWDDEVGRFEYSGVWGERRWVLLDSEAIGGAGSGLFSSMVADEVLYAVGCVWVPLDIVACSSFRIGVNVDSSLGTGDIFSFSDAAVDIGVRIEKCGISGWVKVARCPAVWSRIPIED